MLLSPEFNVEMARARTIYADWNYREKSNTTKYIMCTIKKRNTSTLLVAWMSQESKCTVHSANCEPCTSWMCERRNGKENKMCLKRSTGCCHFAKRMWMCRCVCVCMSCTLFFSFVHLALSHCRVVRTIVRFCVYSACMYRMLPPPLMDFGFGFYFMDLYTHIISASYMFVLAIHSVIVGICFPLSLSRLVFV